MKMRLLIAALFALPFCGPAPAAEKLSFDLPEARRLAVLTGLSGNGPAAAMLAGELLRRDPGDGAALLAMAMAHLTRAEYRAAHAASRRAFRNTDDPEYRYQAARVAAISALAGERRLQSQFWLRRAADMAPTPADRAKIERQFAALRAETPWSYRFDLSVTPSSNVNGGADSAYNIIEGVPLVGILSGSAQALSGYVAQGNARFGYRFHRTKTTQTSVTGALFVKRVWLSDEAKATAPGYDAGRLGVVSLDLGLSHSLAAGPAKHGAMLKFDIGLRDYWQDGKRSYTAMTGAALFTRKLGERFRFTGQLSAQRRFYSGGGHGFAGSANAALSHTFGNGDRLTAMVGYTASDTPVITFDSHGYVGKISYALGKPVLTMDLSAGIGASRTEYPDYSLGFIPVPGGRVDDALFLDIDATFTGIEYAGFSPSLRLRRTITSSNVSRYDTNEWAVSVGIQSNF